MKLFFSIFILFSISISFCISAPCIGSSSVDHTEIGQLYDIYLTINPTTPNFADVKWGDGAENYYTVPTATTYNHKYYNTFSTPHTYTLSIVFYGASCTNTSNTYSILVHNFIRNVYPYTYSPVALNEIFIPEVFEIYTSGLVPTSASLVFSSGGPTYSCNWISDQDSLYHVTCTPVIPYFTTTGAKTFTLTISSGGSSDTLTRSITVNNPYSCGSIQIIPNTSGNSVFFTLIENIALNSVFYPLVANINFGDGNSQNINFYSNGDQSSTSYSYNPGTYTASVTSLCSTLGCSYCPSYTNSRTVYFGSDVQIYLYSSNTLKLGHYYSASGDFYGPYSSISVSYGGLYNTNCYVYYSYGTYHAFYCNSYLFETAGTYQITVTVYYSVSDSTNSVTRELNVIDSTYYGEYYDYNYYFYIYPSFK